MEQIHRLVEDENHCLFYARRSWLLEEIARWIKTIDEPYSPSKEVASFGEVRRRLSSAPASRGTIDESWVRLGYWGAHRAAAIDGREKIWGGREIKTVETAAFALRRIRRCGVRRTRRSTAVRRLLAGWIEMLGHRSSFSPPVAGKHAGESVGAFRPFR